MRLCSTNTEMEGMMRRTVLVIATTMVAAMFAACGVAMLAEEEPAPAAYPDKNDRIAYVSNSPSRYTTRSTP